MIFLTVGTQFPFDRLVRAVDDGVASGAIAGPVFAQIGSTDYAPRAFPWTRALGAREFRDMVQTSRGMISHAGVGSILAALEAEKPIVVLPRMARFGEVVNDHQVLTALRFAERGKVLYARDVSEVPARIREMSSFHAITSRPEFDSLLQRVRSFLEERP